MLTSIKDTYQKVADKNALSPELVQSIGNIVFSHLRECLDERDELSYELPKLGCFNLRMKKFDDYFNVFIKHREETDPALIKGIPVMEKITKFRAEKKIKRDIRYGNKPSEDNTEEHT